MSCIFQKWEIGKISVSKSGEMVADTLVELKYTSSANHCKEEVLLIVRLSLGHSCFVLRVLQINQGQER